MGPHDLLKQMVEAFESLGIPYLVTGSIASMLYGEPRFTNDIDIVADIPAGRVKELKKNFPESEFCFDEEAVHQAIRQKSSFNIIHPASGLKVDVMIRTDSPFDESRFRRGKRLPPSKGWEATFAAPEDVIIKKMEFYRLGGSEKHLRDIAGMLKTSGEMIDQTYIHTWAETLGLMDVWQAICKRLEGK